MNEEIIRELTGEVKPVPPGQSAELNIIKVPFAVTIRSVTYTPNNYLHIGQQGTGVPLRDISLYLTSPQRPHIHVARLDYSRITVYPNAEQPLGLASSEGGVLNVVREDELAWLSESVRKTRGTDFEPTRDTGQRDSGDPGDIVKVVVAAANRVQS